MVQIYNVEQVKNDRIAMPVDCSDIDIKWNQATFNFKFKCLINPYCSTMNMLQLILHLNTNMNSVNGKRLCCSSNINNNDNRDDNGSNHIYKCSYNSASISIKSVRSGFKYNSAFLEIQLEMQIWVKIQMKKSVQIQKRLLEGTCRNWIIIKKVRIE